MRFSPLNAGSMRSTQAEFPLTGPLLIYNKRADNYLIIERFRADKEREPIAKRYDP
jgi:hypothetical protein